MSQIYKARSGIFLHRHKNIMKNDETSTEHKGGSLSTSSDVSRKMASQINNASTGIEGLWKRKTGVENRILSGLFEFFVKLKALSFTLPP